MWLGNGCERCGGPYIAPASVERREDRGSPSSLRSRRSRLRSVRSKSVSRQHSTCLHAHRAPYLYLSRSLPAAAASTWSWSDSTLTYKSPTHRIAENQTFSQQELLLPLLRKRLRRSIYVLRRSIQREKYLKFQRLSALNVTYLLLTYNNLLPTGST